MSTARLCPPPALKTAVLVAFLAASPLAGQDTLIQARSVYEDLRMFSQVLNQIRVNHPDSLDTHALFMAAIEGMVRAADPHSYVLPAYRLAPELEEARRNNKLYPVPIDFVYQDDAPVVVAVHPGTEAAELDILPGDELVAVNGQPIVAESAPELDISLSGEKKSEIALTFQRRRWDGSLATLERVVKRERVEEQSAVGAGLMLDEQTAYLRFLHFGTEHAVEELRDHLGRFEHLGMQRLVLDLRDNGGGIVEQAAGIAGEFLPKGAMVYTSEGRKADVADTARARGSSRRRERELPLVVMVNRGTASAAELIAGALQDHDRAVIVGRPTFGKSLIMRGFPMTDGSVIVLVVGHLKTPCGRIVQRRYQDIRTHDYYRQVGAVPDTTGRPSCVTAKGRTVYGGGGIFPDVLFDEPTGRVPSWLTRVQELQLPLRWLGSYLADTTFADTSPQEFAGTTLPDAVMENFKTFVAGEGVTVPDEDTALLHEVLMLQIAWGQWGPQGYYTVAALHDSRVREAVAEFQRAEGLIGGS
jgi:carboxyl-terminal processing protease